MKHFTTLNFLFFILTSILVSCKNNISNKKIFRFNQVQNVETLDPAFAKNLNIMWHTHLMFNTLIEYDTNMHIQPSLAKSWHISADRTTYTFILRNDVYFHDNDAFVNGIGRKMTAQDIVYSFQRIIDPATASPGAWIFNGHVDTTKAFEALNDSIFVLHLLQPFNPMMGILSMQYCGIVPHEVVDKWGKDFRAHPCGTGPFVLQHWEEATVVTYKKNERYWEKDNNGKSLPYIDGIKVTQVESKASEFLLFMQEKLDFMNGIDASFKDQILYKSGELKEQYQDKIKLLKGPYLNVEYLGFLLKEDKNDQKILLDKKLRKAINLGFDRKKLVTYLRNNIGVAANAGIIHYALPGYDSLAVKGFSYKPDTAKALVQELKKQYGNIPIITLLSNDNYSDRCNFIASQLAHIGLQVQVEIMQPSILREQMSNEKATFFWATWIADYPDAECYLTMFYGNNTAPPNYTRFKNNEYDALYQKALTTQNEEDKMKYYQNMDRILIEESPFVPLFYDQTMHFLQNNISNWYSSPLNLLELKNVKMGSDY